MGVTAPEAPAQLRTVGTDEVLDEIRESCRRRAQPHQLVDEIGLTGVVDGTAPVLWVDSAAPLQRTVELTRAATTLREVLVRTDRDDVVAGLTADGWRPTGGQRHVTCTQALAIETAPADVTIRDCNDPALMPVVRELLASAFDVDPGVLEAAYPDDFFVRAAPVVLTVAEDEQGRVVGIVARRRQGRSTMMFALAVASDRRGSGLATALARHASGAALAEGADFVHALVTEPGHAIARAAGFSETLEWTRFERILPLD